MMELQFDIDTWDIDHFNHGELIKLGYLLEQLLDQLNMTIISGHVVPIEDEEE